MVCLALLLTQRMGTFQVHKTRSPLCGPAPRQGGVSLLFGPVLVPYEHFSAIGWMSKVLRIFWNLVIDGNV